VNLRAELEKMFADEENPFVRYLGCDDHKWLDTRHAYFEFVATFPDAEGWRRSFFFRKEDLEFRYYAPFPLRNRMYVEYIPEGIQESKCL